MRVGAGAAVLLFILPAALAGPLSEAPHGPIMQHPDPALAKSYGTFVVALGDMNGDGWGELAVADPLDAAGRVFVYLGSSAGLPGSGALPDHTLQGLVANGQFGASLASCDWDGDSLADLVVGAPIEPGLAGQARAGRGYVFLAADLTPSLEPEDAALVLAGDAQDHRFGSRVAAGGDADGDGRCDLLASSPLATVGRGSVYLVRGATSGSHRVGSVASAVVQGEGDADELGHHGLAFLGGARWAVGAEHYGADDRGRAYLLQGVPPNGSVAAAAARVWDGEASGDQLGFSLAAHLGPQLLLAAGAPGSDAPSPGSGRAYLLDPAAPSGDAGARARTVLDGFAGGAFGTSLASGDFDGDGAEDLVVGAPVAQHDSFSPGAVVLFPGPLPPGTVAATGPAARVLGDVNSGRFGVTVAVVLRPDEAHPAGLLVGEPRLRPRAHLLLNLPPEAVFDPPVVPCTGPTTLVNLTGEASSDPDGPSDIFSYTWTAPGPPARDLGEGVSIQADFPVGATLVRLEVADLYLARDAAEGAVHVVDADPPSVTLQRPDVGHIYLDDREFPLPGLEVPIVGWATHVGNMTFEAVATDACSEVDRVEFWLDHTLAKVDSEAPYTLTYDPHELVPVFERLRALAWDKAGNGPSEDCLAVVNSGWVSPHHLPVLGEGPPPFQEWGLPPHDLLHVVTHRDPCPGELRLPFVPVTVPLRQL